MARRARMAGRRASGTSQKGDEHQPSVTYICMLFNAVTLGLRSL